MLRQCTLILAALAAALLLGSFAGASDVDFEFDGVIRLGNGRIIIGDWPRYSDYQGRYQRRHRSKYDDYDQFLYNGRRIIIDGDEVIIIRRSYPAYPYGYRAPSYRRGFAPHYKYVPRTNRDSIHLYRTDEFGRTRSYKAPWPWRKHDDDGRPDGRGRPRGRRDHDDGGDADGRTRHQERSVDGTREYNRYGGHHLD